MSKRVLKMRFWRYILSVWCNLLYYLIENFGILFFFKIKGMVMDKDMDGDWSKIIKKLFIDE